MRRLLIAAIAALSALSVFAADPTATRYSFDECNGSYMPYPAVKPVECPDSLVPVMINHVGRHGARFASGDKNLVLLNRAIEDAEKSGALTPAGRELKALCRRIEAVTAGRWGALDSLGMAEQTAIATRMAKTWPSLFDGGRVDAMSSYSPRCIMSMYTFAHQLSRMNNKIEVYTNSGRQNSPLMRPFDSNLDYRDYRATESWKQPLDDYTALMVTVEPLRRVFGKDYSAETPEDMAQLVMAEYNVVASAAAIGIDARAERFFTLEEYNQLWSVSNLRHYFQYSSSILTTATAEMSAPLLRELIDATESGALGENRAAVSLRFGHAETLMPLLALMHLPGCYYMTNYYDTVGLHWRDFAIVPMAANLQLILLKNKDNGRMYLRVDLNEKPVSLIPGRTALYTPWESAKEYLTRCLPLLLQ